MKTLLQFICWIGLAASIYYLGFTWWTIPIFASCMIAVELFCSSSGNAKVNFTISSCALFGLYFAVVAIYVFSGDGYLSRVSASFESAHYFLNPIMVLIMICVWSADYSGSRQSYSNYSDEDDYHVPKNYMSPDDRHFRQTQDEMNRQHQEAEDMGYFK